MEFKVRRWAELQFFVLALVLLGEGIAAASSRAREGAKITVLVNNSAQVSAAVLGRAEDEAGRIFREAGIEMEWVDCAVFESACRTAPGSDQFVLHIVSTGKTSTDSVFGLAFLDQDGSGKYCDVFFDRIAEEERASGMDQAQLLGTVAAHELGHLVLGSHGHSGVGIMSPVWREESLRAIGMGSFLFTREQSSLMKARIGRKYLPVVRLSARMEY
jgi:hypothetical protein